MIDLTPLMTRAQIGAAIFIIGVSIYFYFLKLPLKKSTSSKKR